MNNPLWSRLRRVVNVVLLILGTSVTTVFLSKAQWAPIHEFEKQLPTFVRKSESPDLVVAASESREVEKNELKAPSQPVTSRRDNENEVGDTGSNIREILIQNLIQTTPDPSAVIPAADPQAPINKPISREEWWSNRIHRSADINNILRLEQGLKAEELKRRYATHKDTILLAATVGPFLQNTEIQQLAKLLRGIEGPHGWDGIIEGLKAELQTAKQVLQAGNDVAPRVHRAIQMGLALIEIHLIAQSIDSDLLPKRIGS